MNTENLLKDFENVLRIITQKFQDELRALRSNRPSVEAIEGVKVNYYNEMLTVQQLGSLALGSSNEIQITVWDKSAVAPIVGAIQAANLGFSVQNDGNVIRAFLPALSSERREELQKQVKKTAEVARISIRSSRDEAMKKAKSAEEASEITEDELFKTKEGIQKLVDKENGRVEELIVAKLKELAS